MDGRWRASLLAAGRQAGTGTQATADQGCSGQRKSNEARVRERSNTPITVPQRLASADLFGQGDDDARGAAEVAEQEDVLVLCHLAEEFGAVQIASF